MLILNDNLYGTFTITEPVLLEILDSPALLRLKGISNGGYYPAYSHLATVELSRYSHSLGVFLLLRKFGASLEEQIAGLLHDVSHTAFSHTIDYIVKDRENQKVHALQDNNHENFIKKYTNIESILKKHNLDLNFILDDKNFPLKENNAPDICADRIDYFLRQAHLCGELSTPQINDILNHLVVHNSQFMFDDLAAASLFAQTFYDVDSLHWSGMRTAVMFTLSAQMLRHAIAENYITFENLYHLQDAQVISLLKTKNDNLINQYLNWLELPIEYFENNPDNCFEPIYSKVRNVDPYVVIDYELKRVSELDESFKNLLVRTSKFKEYFVALKK
jgi:HD superfamily phosphohydrolase